MTHLQIHTSICFYVVPRSFGFSISLLCLSRYDKLPCPSVQWLSLTHSSSIFMMVYLLMAYQQISKEYCFEKRLHHRSFPVNFVNYSRTPICWGSTNGWFSNISLFNKIARVTAWRPLTVLERNCRMRIFLWILWNFQKNVFAEHLLATTSHLMLFFPFLEDQWSLQPKINLFGGAMAN